MKSFAFKRRWFLRQLGWGVAAAGGMGTWLRLAAAASDSPPVPVYRYTPVKPGTLDELALSPGFEFQVVISWGTKINNDGESFGFNNDFLAFFPTNAENTEGILWVNHESAHPLFVSGKSHKKGTARNRDDVIKEQKAVGGSLIKINCVDGKWNFVANDKFNRRIDGTTPIPIASDRPIFGRTTAIGTLGNCAGGVTPWGTVLTCEENYHDFVGEVTFDKKGQRQRVAQLSKLGWESVFDLPPEHYGWVVEVEPKTGLAKKLTALGRFAHEGATPRLAPDGRCVVYMGDDAHDECVYKFISHQAGSLERGELFVANVEKGRWVSLSYQKNPEIKKMFKDATEALIRTREAAHAAGGSRLARPEDIEVHPQTGAVYIALTNNPKSGDLHGRILKLEEKDNNPLSLEFKISTFLEGGLAAGLSAPDNLAFDSEGQLWVTNDMSDQVQGQGEFKVLGHNGLFVVPTAGDFAGRPFQIASAPVDAELTGPCFSPDGKYLFLSVQHPGARSSGLDQLTSHWPGGGQTLPRPSVVAIKLPTVPTK